MFRLTFLALVFVTLSSGMAVANEETVAPATVGIAPTMVQLLPMIIPVTVIGALNMAAWLGVGYAIMQYMVLPLVSFIAVMISLWVVLRGISLVIRSFSGSR